MSASPASREAPAEPGAAVGSVAALAITPVKAMRLINVDAAELDVTGVAGDRSFYVIDDRGHMVNGKRFGEFHAIEPAYDRAAGELWLALPDGSRVGGPVRFGEPVDTVFHGQPRRARLVAGPWAQALSDFLGRPLRLVEDGNAIDRGRQATVSLMSRASLERLAEELSAETVDGRRFRMTIEIDGVAAHEEDRWVGRRVRIGPAEVAMHGHIGRCMVTTRSADTGRVDLKTLHGLAAYRGAEETAEPLPFGVYGEVLTGGVVRLGDPVSLVTP